LAPLFSFRHKCIAAIVQIFRIPAPTIAGIFVVVFATFSRRFPDDFDALCFSIADVFAKKALASLKSRQSVFRGSARRFDHLLLWVNHRKP